MEQNEEVESEEPELDSKGNITNYDNSAFARPRTKGKFKEFNELNDRVDGHE